MIALGFVGSLNLQLVTGVCCGSGGVGGGSPWQLMECPPAFLCCGSAPSSGSAPASGWSSSVLALPWTGLGPDGGPLQAIPLHVQTSQGAGFVCGVSRCEEVAELSKSWFSCAAF